MSFLCYMADAKMQAIIRAENLTHSYIFSGRRHRSLDGLTLAVRRGEMVAVLGINGSGKTTLLRHVNVLLEPQEGTLTVASLDARDRANVWQIREKTGMVFQDPDNQFVSSDAEEDLAFAPSNYGIPEDEIPGRIRSALELVGLSGFEKRSPHLLSGGQKQRLAIAGVLTYDPDILLFDEVTSMLDPDGKADVMRIILELRGSGRTVLMVTHEAEEAVSADRVILMKDGRVLADGTPETVLTDRERLREAGLEPPLPVRLYYDLAERGRHLRRCPLTLEELADLL